MKKLSTLLALSLFLACSSAPTAGALDAQNLAGRNFSLVMVDGEEFSSEYRQPFVAFDDKLNITGRICNNFVGQASLRNNILSAPAMASTRMQCSEDSINQVEIWFSQMLIDGAQLSLDGPMLTMRGQGHTLQFEEQGR